MAEQKEPERRRANEKEATSHITGKLCENMTYSAREAFKRLRTNVLIGFPEKDSRKCKIIGVTSAQPAEGKSTVSVNLAYSLAELDKRVMLIEGDMRRPSLNVKLNCRLSPGLSELLQSSDNIGASVVRYTGSKDKTAFELIPGGEIPNNPSELLNSERFRKLLNLLASACDYIIIDLPPVGMVIDAVNVCRYVDGMIVVVRENNCPRFLLNDCIEQLRYAKANILGFVVNGSVEGASKRYQYSRYTRYGEK